MVGRTREEAEQTRERLIEAARTVFYRDGVSQSTLEDIAKEAGVTRGAVYWHFKNKAELFCTMRKGVVTQVVERADSFLFSKAYENPLDAIENSIKAFFGMLDNCSVTREVFVIMISRCEYVDEFAKVQQQIADPTLEFLKKLEYVYHCAEKKAWLREGLSPRETARDTWAFTTGLLHLRLAFPKDRRLEQQIQQMISTHMALRYRR